MGSASTARYEIAVHRRHGEGSIIVARGKPPLPSARTARWQAEELLLGAIGLDLMTTFQGAAEREQLLVFAYDSRVSGAVDAEHGLVVHVHVHVCVASAWVPHATALLEQARRNCVIVNALAVPVAFEVTVKAHHEPAHSPRE